MIATISVDADAIASNARALARLVAPARAAFVVKSNAYGHGLAAVAKIVEPVAQCICVYGLDEAVVLRESGISARIFVMGPVRHTDLEEALMQRIEIALWDTGMYLREVAASAAKRNRRFPVHVKINTGVARLGLETHDAPDAIEDYARTAGIDIAGIFSHLASAEELDSPFTATQLARYNAVLAQVQPALERKQTRPLRHIAASAAGMLWPQTRLDMVRFGIALYGLWPSPQTREAAAGLEIALAPALSYHSTIVAVRDVDAGTAIGYGGTYHTPRPTRVGVIPVGYADGIPRLLSNRGYFVVRGERCPIIGRVCMNMTMIDLAEVPGACTGEKVTLIGSNDVIEVGADDWAHWARTINYEIVTRLPQAIPRTYESRPNA